MANPVLKFVTIFGSNNGQGWTEVHYKQSASANPDLNVQLNNFILNVTLPRVTLLGEDCYVAGTRVSYPRVGAIASNGKRQKYAGAAGHTGSAAALSLAVEFQNADFTKSKITHLRGFWDSVEYDEAYHGEADADWTARLTAWIEALKGGYGWLSKDPALSQAGPVLSYSVGVDRRVTFLLDPAFPIPAPLPGMPVNVRFSKFHDSRSILNRALMVSVVDATTLSTVNPIGADPLTSKGHFNYRGTSFVGYTSSDSISVGERRMGKPLNRQPGRSKARVLS